MSNVDGYSGQTDWATSCVRRAGFAGDRLYPSALALPIRHSVGGCDMFLDMARLQIV